MRRILILGGGAGGALLANLLARKLVDYESEITVVSAAARHHYQAGWLYVPFGRQDSRKLSKPLKGLLNRRVNLMVGEVREINSRDQRVRLMDERELDYDFLVVATGSRVVPQEIPGLEAGGHHFHTQEAAARLFVALQEFRGGRVVVGWAGLPCKCPLAAIEFAFLLEEFLETKGVRADSEITFASPFERVSPMDGVAEVVERHFGLRGIRVEPSFTLHEVLPAEKRVLGTGGRSLPFDLLVMVPPHRGARCLEGQAWADDRGWVRTDPRSLLVRGHTATWALGDAADLPVEKLGSAAHFQAPVLTEQIVAAIQHRKPDPARSMYGGHVICFLEVGHHLATLVDYDYDRPPVVKEPNAVMHYLKMAFNKGYFALVPTGVA